MARKRVVVLDTDKAVRLSEVSNVEGYYLGFKSIEGDLGTSKLHVFQGETGNVGVWGFQHLDSQLTTVTPGTMTYLAYGGTRPSKKKGRRPAHLASVEIDDELTISVQGATTNNSELEADASSEPDYDDSDASNNADAYGDEEEESNVDTTPVTNISSLPKGKPTTISSDAVAKAQALLAKARASSAAVRKTS